MGANYPKSDKNGSIKVKVLGSGGVKKDKHHGSDLGADFVAPDGGWGWFVCIAAGCSNLCSFALLQQFGLLFRDRLNTLGMLNSEITTIINLQSGLTSCMGLLNGPMFRIFSYRQVAFCSAVLFSIGVFLTSLSNSFTTYILTFSVLYGIGSGINASANALALNTYFKEKRRIATGCSWTLTALGPIVFPQIIALLLPAFGVQGTVMIFAGISLNAVALALLYHPVQWHTKPPIKNEEDPIEKPDFKCLYCQYEDQKVKSLFSSQYLYNQDSHSITGYEIIDPGTPMLSRANDGWYSRSNYGSRMSLSSTKIQSRINSSQNLTISNKPSYVNLNALGKELKVESRTPTPNRTIFGTNVSGRTKEEKREKRKEFSNRIRIDEAPSEDCDSHKAPQDTLVGNVSIIVDNKKNDFQMEKNINLSQHYTSEPTEHSTLLETDSNIKDQNVEKMENLPNNGHLTDMELLKGVTKKLEQYTSPMEKEKPSLCTCEVERKLVKHPMDTVQETDCDKEIRENYTFIQKLLVFFDLDLLKDMTYVNLMVGVTIAGFAELNYSILTPFVLAEYHFTKTQIATVMSLLGAMDISVRFFVPFIAGKIGWENKTFFLVGVMGMALGRISIAHFHSYEAVLIASLWIGLNKGLRTVFMALVIPTYVPLHRLPGASGLQLLFAGIFYFTMGPVIGWIRDATNYTVTLHCLNIATYLTCISWTLEKVYRSHMERKKMKLNCDL